MIEPLAQLLEKMRTSRAALARQLEQLPARDGAIAKLAPTKLTPKGLGIAIGVALAVAALLPARRKNSFHRDDRSSHPRSR